jgi:hypothetical protein
MTSDILNTSARLTPAPFTTHSTRNRNARRQAMAVAADSVSSPGQYPVRLDIPYPETLNRWLPLVKWLLAIPHWIILYFLDLAARVVTLIAFFAILFTTRYPEGLFRFVVGVRRWQVNVTAYALFMRDEYPPFSMEPGEYPAVFEVEYPRELNRWMPLIKWLLAIPHYVVLLFLGIAAFVVLVIAFFAILFTTKFPSGMFEFVVGVSRWSQRVTAYVLLMTDEYPPFSLK